MPSKPWVNLFLAEKPRTVVEILKLFQRSIISVYTSKLEVYILYQWYNKHGDDLVYLMQWYNGYLKLTSLVCHANTSV